MVLSVSPRRLLGLSLMSLALIGGSGCVSMDEHKRLQTAFDESRRQLAEAENDLGRLRSRISDLETRLAQKDKLLDAQGGGVVDLLKQIDSLKKELADARKKLDEWAKNAEGPKLPEQVNNALRELADKNPDLLEFDESRGLVRFKSDLLFDLGSTEIRPQAREALLKFAAILNMPEIKSNEVRVVGNTDDVPIRQSKTMVLNPTNWHLSTNRAIAVMDVLKSAVPETRFQVAGWGPNRPISPNVANHRGNEKNRRVDIYILPTTAPAAAAPSGLAPVTPKPAAKAAKVAKPAPTIPVPTLSQS